jgi:hypothetical protein
VLEDLSLLSSSSSSFLGLAARHLKGDGVKDKGEIMFVGKL